MSVDKFEFLINGIIDKDYGAIDNFIPMEWVDLLSLRLEERFENGEFKFAGIGKEEFFDRDKEIRNDQIHWLYRKEAQPTELLFLEHMDRFMNYLNKTCFTALHDHEFHYAVYKEGSFYKRHLDQFRNDESRLFSAICYLNKDWKEDDGGELVLYLPEGPKRILPEAGRLVFFRSDLLEHEVLPTNRERRSITGWMKTA